MTPLLRIGPAHWIEPESVVAMMVDASAGSSRDFRLNVVIRDPAGSRDLLFRFGSEEAIKTAIAAIVAARSDEPLQMARSNAVDRVLSAAGEWAEWIVSPNGTPTSRWNGAEHYLFNALDLARKMHEASA